MSAQLSAYQAQNPNASSNVNRPLASYASSIWSEHFLSYTSREIDPKLEQRAQKLKEAVKTMLLAPAKNPSQKLNLIDDIQRLGVSYHFEKEIDEILQSIHKNSSDCNDLQNDDDLYTAALRFRLLRQHGFNVPCDMFNKFKDNDGKFKESLVNDAKGLLSLYEAAHLMIRGENLLDEALTFATTHLESVAYRLSPPLSKQVTHALYQPLRRGLPRVEARHYLSIFEERDSHDETLLNFAKLDFNLLQKLYQKELNVLTRWWKELDVCNKLPFARDKVVESYFIWSFPVYFEPQYSSARIIIGKMISLLSLVDDIYDSHGTLEELELFTEAFERFDNSMMEQLPEYMKLPYVELLKLYSEIEKKVANEGKLYSIHYAIKEMKRHIRNYLEEAKWMLQKRIPTIDEYIPVSLLTCGYSSITTTAFVIMGDNAVTKDSLDWLLSDPLAVQASAVICRLMDDVTSRKCEFEVGQVPSALDCYMKHQGMTEEEAIIELRKQVNDGWKDLNQECLHPTPVPMHLLTPILNLARTMDVTFKKDDGYTNSDATVLNGLITSVLVEPVPI